MQKLIDLHTHSTVSDGSMTPRELVRHAKEKGLAAFAMTDHDTVAGIEDALDEGEKQGIEVVPGIEIGVGFKPEMHLLGYFFNGRYQNIRGILDRLQRSREERNPKIVKKLNELGMDITMEEVWSQAGGDIVARPHVAKVLVKKGYVRSIGEAFDKYLADDRPAYFKKDKLTPEEGIREIRKAGGIPVLAHPIYLRLSWRTLDELLAHLVDVGLKGIETYYVDNTGRDTRNTLELARKHQLLMTGGSDFHGNYKPHIEIGKGRGNLEIPYDLLTDLKNSTTEGE